MKTGDGGTVDVRSAKGGVWLGATPAAVWMTRDEAEELANELFRLANTPIFDPDAALERARTLISRIGQADSTDGVALWAAELTDVVQALDDHLTGGGDPPRAWMRDPVRDLSDRVYRT